MRTSRGHVEPVARARSRSGACISHAHRQSVPATCATSSYNGNSIRVALTRLRRAVLLVRPRAPLPVTVAGSTTVSGHHSSSLPGPAAWRRVSFATANVCNSIRDPSGHPCIPDADELASAACRTGLGARHRWLWPEGPSQRPPHDRLARACCGALRSSGGPGPPTGAFIATRSSAAQTRWRLPRRHRDRPLCAGGMRNAIVRAVGCPQSVAGTLPSGSEGHLPFRWAGANR